MNDTSDIRTREPFFNAPPLALLLPTLLVLFYGLQVLAGPEGNDQIINGFALNALLLRNGGYELLLSYMFLHGSWAHVLGNAGFLLAFGTPVVRACGRGVGGVISYMGFYLLCGAVAGFGFCLLNYYSGEPIVGASGAISGMMGAAMRLRGVPGESGRLAPLTDSRVIGMTVFWIGMNALQALVPIPTGMQGVTIAWQAHIVGYLFGLVMIGPWLMAFHRRYFTTS